MQRKNFMLFVFIISIIFQTQNLPACELCTIPRLGQPDILSAESQNKKWYFKYLFENQNWDEKDAHEAHQLHHQGSHFHDKTNEYIHHFELGTRLNDVMTITLDTPYVIRQSLEIDNHAILGSRQRSEGLGDMHLAGIYRFWESGTTSLSALGGLKLPTGLTKEKNSVGDTFETEMQPGTGSLDYIAGGIYQKEYDPYQLTANLIYVVKTEGTQNYEFGDLTSTSVIGERAFKLKNTTLKAGVDTNLQFEQKHRDNGRSVKDSGGTTVLVGPTLTLQANPSMSFASSFQWPAYQDLGGVHQKLDYIWTASGKLLW